MKPTPKGSISDEVCVAGSTGREFISTGAGLDLANGIGDIAERVGFSDVSDPRVRFERDGMELPNVVGAGDETGVV